jgi:hypothetical protein
VVEKLMPLKALEHDFGILIRCGGKQDEFIVLSEGDEHLEEIWSLLHIDL